MQQQSRALARRVGFSHKMRGVIRNQSQGEPPQMEFQDKVLKCVDCNTDFVFSVGEQIFYRDKQFRNEPKRCKTCKTKTKRISVMGDSTTGRGPSKIETRAICSHCGRDTTVPFRPTQGRPVLCRDCFQGSRTAALGD
jgi:CxxC-x17-CxxC domain-containing protein